MKSAKGEFIRETSTKFVQGSGIQEEYYSEVHLDPVTIKSVKSEQSLVIRLVKYSDGECRMEMDHEIDGNNYQLMSKRINPVTFEVMKPKQYRDRTMIEARLGNRRGDYNFSR